MHGTRAYQRMRPPRPDFATARAATRGRVPSSLSCLPRSATSRAARPPAPAGPPPSRPRPARRAGARRGRADEPLRGDELHRRPAVPDGGARVHRLADQRLRAIRATPHSIRRWRAAFRARVSDCRGPPRRSCSRVCARPRPRTSPRCRVPGLDPDQPGNDAEQVVPRVDGPAVRDRVVCSATSVRTIGICIAAPSEDRRRRARSRGGRGHRARPAGRSSSRRAPLASLAFIHETKSARSPPAAARRARRRRRSRSGSARPRAGRGR